MKLKGQQCFIKSVVIHFQAFTLKDLGQDGLAKTAIAYYNVFMP